MYGTKYSSVEFAIAWKDFVKSMHKRRDPVSIYIKKSKKGESAGRIKAIAVTVAIALAIAAAAFVYLKLRWHSQKA